MSKNLFVDIIGLICITCLGFWITSFFIFGSESENIVKKTDEIKPYIEYTLENSGYKIKVAPAKQLIAHSEKTIVPEIQLGILITPTKNHEFLTGYITIPSKTLEHFSITGCNLYDYITQEDLDNDPKILRSAITRSGEIHLWNMEKDFKYKLVIFMAAKEAAIQGEGEIETGLIWYRSFENTYTARELLERDQQAYKITHDAYKVIFDCIKEIEQTNLNIRFNKKL